MAIERSSYDQHWHNAVLFAETIILGARDWQDVQDALANHPVHGPWLRRNPDPLVQAQGILREAEDNLGDRVPY